MPLLDSARLIARGAAFEVPRYFSEKAYKRQFAKQLKLRDVSAVLDVGANSGQYAAGLRKAGYKGRIISFEPLASPFSELERRAAGDPLWDCRKYALGSTDGTVAINVAGNAGQSSSVLPMLKTHQDVCPAANYIGTEMAAIHRLDSVVQELLKPAESVFLKIDVQGFEKEVLAGGEDTVSNRCVGLQLELSFLPLYEGGMLIREALDFAYSSGFTLTGLLPCFTDLRDGRMLQADGVFFRNDG